MKIHLFAALLLASTLSVPAAQAQPVPFNEAGVTMGHWHIISKDADADKKILIAMGAKVIETAGAQQLMFPGLYINVNSGRQNGEGGTVGTVVNHVGFIVDDVAKRTAEWKAKGVNVLPGGNGRKDQAFVETPDGVRIEILEDKTQTVPIKNEHVHFFLPEAEIPKAVAWYAKTFGGKAGTRNNAPVVDLPGVQLRYNKADKAQAPTKGHILDHIGFDVKDTRAFAAKVTAEGIALDEPVRTGNTGSTITYIHDPWGTGIEIIQRSPRGTPK